LLAADRRPQPGTEELSGFSGLAQGAPALAAVMVVFLLSLTGIPPTAGFVGKLYLFAAAIRSGTWWWLAFVGIINSAISLYYYMNIVRLMYFGQPARSWGQGHPASPAWCGCAWWAPWPWGSCLSRCWNWPGSWLAARRAMTWAPVTLVVPTGSSERAGG